MLNLGDAVDRMASVCNGATRWVRSLPLKGGGSGWGSHGRPGRQRAWVTATLLAILAAAPAATAGAPSAREVEAVVAQEIAGALHPEGIGAAVAVLIGSRTLYFNFGLSDRAGGAPVTSDSLFNLASVSKVFDATLLALAIKQGEVKFDDRIGDLIGELKGAGDAHAMTLGELASFTSGFFLPQDHPPWPYAHYTWPDFARLLQGWTRDERHPPGRYVYSHAGFMLLHVALERRFGMPYARLLEERLLHRLGLASTTLPLRGPGSVGDLAPALMRRAVQGHARDGSPIGKPGDMQGYYHWPGTGQMFSSARDLARLIAAALGETPADPELAAAMAFSHRELAPIEERAGVRIGTAMAWELHHREPTIIDKNGGLNNSTTYIGMIPQRRLGVVLLINRGELNGRDYGQPILLRLARWKP